MSLGTLGDVTIISCALSNTRALKAIKDPSNHKGVSIVISCSKCTVISKITGQSWWQPARVARSFRNAGWDVDGEGRAARCPECRKRRRDRDVEIPIGKSVAPIAPEFQAPTPVAAPAVAAAPATLSIVPSLPDLEQQDATEQNVAEETHVEAQTPVKTQTPVEAPAIEVDPPLQDPHNRRGRSKNRYKPRVCEYAKCGKRFRPTGPKAKYCSHACQRAFHGRPAEFENRPQIKRDTKPRSKKSSRRRALIQTQTPRAPTPAAELRRLMPDMSDRHVDPAASAPPQTPEALKAERKMYTLLDEHFLDEQHHYESGWSDDRVSTESGVAVARVTFVREGLHGKVVDPFMVALQEDVSDAISKIKAERITLAALVRDTFDRQEKELRELLARVIAKGG